MADAGFSLRVEGEESFNKSLARIDAQIKANKNTLRGLTAEYNTNGNGIDALKQKTEVLQGSIVTQTQKVDILRRQMNDSAAAYGETSKATLDLKIKYEAAKATLSELNGTLAKNEKEIADAQNKTGDYTSSLELLDARLTENASKLELTVAQHTSAKQATALNADKVKILTDNVAAQNEKLEVLRSRLAAVESEYGTGSKEASEYRTSINKAEAELAKMNASLGKSKTALADASGNTSLLSKELEKIASQFGVTLPTSLKSTTDKLDGFTVAGTLAATALIALGKKLVQFSIDASKSADDILTLSSVTGMTTDRVQELKYAAELVDVSFETISGSTTKMIRTMTAAQQGTQAAKDAFRELHVRITDTNGEFRDANEIFYQIIDRLGKVRNETERDALAMQIFGKSARELNPLIEAGSARLKELADEAHNAGYVMDNEMLAKYGDLNDSMERMNNAATAAKNSLGVILLPILTDLFTAISKMNPETLKTVVIITGVIAGIVGMVVAVKKMTDATKGIMDFFSGMSAAASKTTLIILGVVAALIALGIIIAVIIGRGGELKASFSEMGRSVAQVQSSVQSAQTTKVPAYARGTSYHPGGRALVGENGPEVVELPRGSKVYPNKRGSASGGAVNNYYITIPASDIKEFNDIVRIAESRKQSTRLGYAGV